MKRLKIKSHKGEHKWCPSLVSDSSSTSCYSKPKWQFGSDVTGNNILLCSRDDLVKEHKSCIDSLNSLSNNNVVPCPIKDIIAFNSNKQGLRKNDKILDSTVNETSQVTAVAVVLHMSSKNELQS